MPWDSLEDAFKELDKQEYEIFAKSLSTYLTALMDARFTRRESFRLIENYAKYLYDMSFEDYIQSHQEDVDEEEDDSDEDVDTDDENDVA